MSIKVLEHITLIKDGYYNSFPSIAALADGTYRLGYRQAPDRKPQYDLITHVDASSKAVSLHSRDGLNWPANKDVIWDDFFHGVQDPCLNVLRDGTVFATYFTWKVCEKADMPQHPRPGTYHMIMDNWAGIMAGTYTIRSADGGKSWDKPRLADLGDVVIRGNCVELEDGSILAPLYGQHENSGGASDVVLGRTADRGQTWERLAIIGSEGGLYHFHEPNLYRTPSGKLILFIRSVHRSIEADKRHLASPLFTAESTDNGLTWSEPKMWPIYSPSPFHLLRLKDDRIVLSYGYRLAPYGVRALVLDPECANLGTAEETVLRDDGHGTDIGYTSAVQLADGRVLVVYYYYGSEEDYSRYIAGTLCEIE